jgi:hypothetical protein
LPTTLPHPQQGKSDGSEYVTPEEFQRLLKESDEAIADWAAEHGPIPEGILAEVRDKWADARPVR